MSIKQLEMKRKNKGTLGANVLGNMWAGRSFIWAAEVARATIWRGWGVIQADEGIGWQPKVKDRVFNATPSFD